ncbi:right-handed parallel beta-helix repeat-containing protein [Neptunicella marina]|uniref:Right-handed parallel beta-helix repeat-containing protein n=1 Tax=Neptunicella marina TaxID=2125989 RepID=A0A8J6J0U4_9ALTE|nr:right-handed parallel beta-helix repeat-containing protein [Neptunicella marina]MBC3767638.1 right-handed parallel beta-helix repeat-containing protein [Neptunicella marina]
MRIKTEATKWIFLLLLLLQPLLLKAQSERYAVQTAPVHGLKKQPGEQLLQQLNSLENFNQLAPSQKVAQIGDILTGSEVNIYVAGQLQPLVTEVSYLVLGQLQGQNLSTLLINLAQSDSEELVRYVQVALWLYPLDSYRLLNQLRRSKQFPVAVLEQAAQRNELDQGWQFILNTAPTAAIKIQPLFHSASVTLFERQPNEQANVRFRPLGSQQWQIGLDLQWEPVRGALSGSIVHLQPATSYEVEITLFKPGQAAEQIQQSFSTRANSPPIDPNKVYHLADIYQGGKLDLNALHIQGSANGWAKIIGSPDTPIVAGEGDNAAIGIGDNSYILFENITVVGGRLNAISSYKAHHLWFNGCDISGWGRAPNIVKNGQYYESVEDQEPSNYDSAFALRRTGVVVVEHCHVHSPRAKANSWEFGHPKGPNAFLASANHPDPDFKGQIVLRHNRFYGSEQHRLNDVIEGESNVRMWGGFVRDSAIYDNYFAYANDDVVELDGGQSNILFYRNELEQGYCGISAIPNQLGPSYIFNNTIHHLGDERGRSWAAFKLGGLYAAPAGRTLIFNNLVLDQSANGVGASNFAQDYTYWSWVQNNIFINQAFWQNKGYAVIDNVGFGYFANNLMVNLQAEQPRVQGQIDVPYQFETQLPADFAKQLNQQQPAFTHLPVGPFAIDNFAPATDAGRSVVGIPAQGDNTP